MQGADWLLRCARTAGALKQVSVILWGFFAKQQEKFIPATDPSRRFFAFTKYGPCYHHCKKKKQQQQQQQARQQKMCLAGGELKKKTVNMFLESYSAIFSRMQF